MTEGCRDLQHLLEKVYRERGFDFREYKETTLTRRLGRRLRARGAETYADYGRVLDDDPAEYDKLFDDLTINVTSFFRDDVAFKALEEIVLPTLTPNTQHATRIWSAGCATGEEPYSIAMLLLETLGTRTDELEITPSTALRQSSGQGSGHRILATDIDAKALGRARQGVFGPKEVEGIQPAWLERYFVAEGDAFRVQPALRRLVSFEAHSLGSVPPYRDLDLVVCRNVFIYFAPTLQTRVLRGFHEGLRKGGFLLLGKAEVPMGETKGLFQCVDKKAKLYMKRESVKREDVKREIRHHVSRFTHHVVVIAASAGGIDALRQVLSRLPADLPAAVLIVQHLRDDRPTRLHEHLARHSSLPVRLAQDGLALEAGVVYLAVPGQHLRVENERLALKLGKPVHYVRPSADVLFASAAQVFGPKVIGVVLSGTGHDGARGCQEIKAKGGMTIAQDEKTSRYFAMPRAAIEADAVDYVLSLEKIAGKIVALLRQA